MSIDLNIRKKYAEQKKLEKMFSNISSMITNSVQDNQKDLEGRIEGAVTNLLEKEAKEFRITKGEDFYIDLTKFIIKRLDIQIMLLMEIHKDLKLMQGGKWQS